MDILSNPIMATSLPTSMPISIALCIAEIASKSDTAKIAVGFSASALKYSNALPPQS